MPIKRRQKWIRSFDWLSESGVMKISASHQRPEGWNWFPGAHTSSAACCYAWQITRKRTGLDYVSGNGCGCSCCCYFCLDGNILRGRSMKGKLCRDRINEMERRKMRMFSARDFSGGAPVAVRFFFILITTRLYTGSRPIAPLSIQMAITRRLFGQFVPLPITSSWTLLLSG